MKTSTKNRIFLLFTLIIGLIILSSSSPSHAQSLQVAIKGGVVTGTPYGKIPEGATGGPGAGLYAALQTSWFLGPRWGLQLDLAYAQKNAYYDSPISGKVAPTQEIFGVPIQSPISFPYAGRAAGRYDNLYLDIPLSLVYQTEGRFSFHLGGYAAYLIKGAHTGNVDIRVINIINVEQDFDETRLLNQWDIGITVGMEMAIIPRIFSFVGLQLGLININSQNPEGLEGIYRNIYLNAGLKYRLLNWANP